MKKLSESFIDDVIRRSRNDEVREEDKFKPEYIDFRGISVYWMKHNFDEFGDTVKYDDIKDFNRKGWRLPTKEEVEELEPCWSNACISRDGDCRIIRLHKNDEYHELEINTSLSHFYMWMNSSRDDDNSYGYSYLNFIGSGYTRPDSQLYVLLVKSKYYDKDI